MAQPTDGFGLKLGFAALVVLAVGVAVLVTFDPFSLRQWLFGGPQGNIPVGNAARDRGDDDGSKLPGDGRKTFSLTPPDDSPYRINEPELPKTLTLEYQAPGYRMSLDLVLVPQGFFIQGEDDGVAANMPRRWTWLDSYYIGRTELTNEQYFYFILRDGYRSQRHWTPDGWNWVQANNVGGTPVIGWNVDREERVASLVSPRGEISIQGFDKSPEGGRGPKAVGARMYILPPVVAGAQWQEWLSVERQDGNRVVLWANTGNEWRSVSGRELEGIAELAPWRHTADDQGTVTVTTDKPSISVLAFLDGLDNPPLLREVRLERNRMYGGPRKPVCFISWFEADACARFLGGRLPTEAQWEKAARGVDGRLLPWGDRDFRASSRPVEHVASRSNFNSRQVKDVGLYPDGASPYGALDMAGNVSEWTLDHYIHEAYKLPEYGTANPLIRGRANVRRSVRGSSHTDDDSQIAKMHNRREGNAGGGNDTMGMRVVFSVKAALALRDGKPPPPENE